MLTIEHIAEVLKSAVVPYDVRTVYLFGSFARGEAGPQSDVDVRLECDLEIDYADLLEMVANPLEFMRPAFRKRMQRDEEVLYTAAERDLDLISVIIETMRGLLQPVSNVSPLMGRSS